MNDSHRLEIAYILTPITFGGAEKVSLNFLKTVDRTRFHITPILLLRPWEEPPLFAQEIVKLGYEYQALPVSLKRGGDTLRVLRVIWRLFKLLRAGKFDLVHTHGYFADICAIPVARMLGLKTISTCHGFITNNKILKLYNKINICAIKLCHQVSAVSEGIKQQLTAAGVKSHKVTVIPNAVETEFDTSEIASLRENKRKELQVEDGEFVVGFLGRLSIEKGANFLIDAVAELITDGLPIRLLIVGDGDERTNLEAQVAQKGITQNVTFAGFQVDTQNWLSAFDLFALPSLTEGTPMALLEAMAMGVPVIATAVGGVPDIIDDRLDGLLFSPKDSTSIAESIKTIMLDSGFTNDLITSSQKKIHREYSLDRWCKNMSNLYIDTITHISAG